MLKLLEFDSAALVSRNFVANYCKGNEFGSIVSETYDAFMDESPDLEQCINNTKTKLIEFVCKTKNKYFDEQDLDEHITWDYLVKCCIERRDILSSFDKNSKAYKDYLTFMKFYIATMWKYGVYKAVMKSFYSILIDKSKIKPEDYDKCVSDFGPYVDLKHKELLAEFLSTDDSRCKIFDIQNLSICENKRDAIVKYINQYACDDKALLVCSLFTIKILNEIKKHCNENQDNGSDEWYSPKYMRIGTKILKDESAMVKSGHRTSIFSFCKLKNLYVLSGSEFEDIMNVVWLTYPDNPNILAFYNAYAEFHKSLEEFFSGNYQHFLK